MIRKIKQIIVLIILYILINVLLLSNVYASSSASIEVSSKVNLKTSFNVTLKLPSNAYAAQATIKITFSNGTVQSKKLVYVQGMSSYSNTVTFTADVEGTAKIEATNIILSDSSSNSIENNGSTSSTITIVDPNASTQTSSSQATTTQTTTSSGQSSQGNDGVTFTSVNETVYTLNTANLRKSYSTSSGKVKTVYDGVALNRIGVGSNGWSKINYNGQEVYILSSLVTTTAPASVASSNTVSNNIETENVVNNIINQAQVNITDTNVIMYAKSKCNVRESYSTSSSKVGGLKAGEEVKVTGNVDNGWSRIDYNGKVAYVLTKLLTSEASNENEISNDVNSVENNLEDSIINETSTNIVENNLTEIEILQQNIGVLPEVGNNISTVMFKVIAYSMIFISISIIVFNNKYKKDV